MLEIAGGGRHKAAAALRSVGEGSRAFKRAAVQLVEAGGRDLAVSGKPVSARRGRCSSSARPAVLPRALGARGIRDVCLSVPVAVGVHPAGGRLPIPLDGGERQALAASAETLEAPPRTLDL